ncbi:TPA: hypothetical protein IFB41_001144 [Escherichia coli]|nr:hypothetical protein [Escherichia coli]
MSTLTKEWLQQTIAEYEANRDELPFGLDTNSAIELQAFKLALASLEAEPVAYMHRSGQVVTREECCDDKTFAICCKVETPLYTAPPAPVSVPDEIEPTVEAIKRVLPTSNPDEYAACIGADMWNACRAAMLQGAGGNSPVIPECSCHACRPVTFADSRFVVCPDCGNKRCPHANDHRHACTKSNEPGQEGSAYPAAPQQEE